MEVKFFSGLFLLEKQKLKLCCGHYLWCVTSILYFQKWRGFSTSSSISPLFVIRFFTSNYTQTANICFFFSRLKTLICMYVGSTSSLSFRKKKHKAHNFFFNCAAILIESNKFLFNTFSTFHIYLTLLFLII